ncbi:MAG: TrkH family potassium uptake protein [Peptoniphilus sp.]|nr:TrkH family potassium uptake protein [Peptoniphilus sp.]MDY3118633.1 TrkH family potassium uptake protein [Peptoniphilus sp.]
MKLPNRLHKKISHNPPFVLGISFLVLITVGTLLLALPQASADRTSVGFVDALFTSTSASCVTGLIVKNTATEWSVFGKCVIIGLIQIGGLGTMTMLMWISIFTGQRISLTGRLYIREQLNADSLSGLVRLIKFATLLTLAVESTGALLLATHLVPLYGLKRGIAYAFFHSVSAFCNAGFDLFGDSLVSFQGDFVVTLTVAALIILGGLGFIVYADLWRYKRRRRLSPHTKLVLVTTVALLITGTAMVYVFECNNVLTLKPMPFSEKLLASFFQSATFRTAGFNSLNMGDITDPTAFGSLLYMFIGGSPGSTAGGLKTTTFAIVLAATWASLRGREDTDLFHRRVGKDTVRKAYSLFVIGVSLVFFVSAVVVMFEGGRLKFLSVLFETFSAFGTVGVTRGITQILSDPSKLILAFTMYLGRIGPTTFAMGLFQREHKRKFRYAEGKFIVG